METRSRTRGSRTGSERKEAENESLAVSELTAIAEEAVELEEEVVPPVENPAFAQFRQFQMFQAYMAANPAPRLPVFVPGLLDRQPNNLMDQVDPGRMVAMSQVKAPLLEGLSAAQIRNFRVMYRRYSARCVVNEWRQLPGTLVTPEHLLVIASRNGIYDLEELRTLGEEEFFARLCAIHHAASTREWHSIVTQVKMTGAVCSLEKFIEYADELDFNYR